MFYLGVKFLSTLAVVAVVALSLAANIGSPSYEWDVPANRSDKQWLKIQFTTSARFPTKVCTPEGAHSTSY